MTPLATRRSRGLVALAVAALLGTGVSACGDDPFAFDWSDIPDTVLLYSLARPELNLVSAFSFFQGLPVRVEAAAASGSWDIAVDTRGGEIVLLPPGALGVVGRAAISTLPNMTLADVTEAPTDTLLYETDGPVSLATGNVYVVRTNRSTGSFGSSCVYYAKLSPVDIDAAGGTLTFEFVTNPICNSIDLVPPD
ncbi:MAG: hypothetical protein AAF389_16505 [Gemmatimonadota bacterium]